MRVFGSLQKGGGRRFASSDLDTPAVTTDHTQPSEYAALRHGPEFTLELEDSLSAPVDGSNAAVRSLSPFMIRLEPPLAYADQSTKGRTHMGDILAAGHRHAPTAFQSARKRILQDIPGGDLISGAPSAEAFVAGGFVRRGEGGGNISPGGVSASGSRGRIGAPAISDLYTAADIALQLRGVVDTPPLILLINPQSLSMSYNKIQQYSDRSRFGFVFQASGEEQPKLNVTARCGAFISGGRGVQWASRRDSAAWQNLATAFSFYKNNGYIYDTIGKSNAHHFVGALSIHYDGWIYYGNMESFNYTFEEAQQHGGVTFEIDFTVNAASDTSSQSLNVTPMRSLNPSPSDPRAQGPRAPALPPEAAPQPSPPPQAALFSSPSFPPAAPPTGHEAPVRNPNGWRPPPAAAIEVADILPPRVQPFRVRR